MSPAPAPEADAPEDRRRRYPWGEETPAPEQANLDGRTIGCLDVGALPAGDSAAGCRQTPGYVWAWTDSVFHPCPGHVVDQPCRNYFRTHRNDIIAGYRTCAL